MDINGTCAVLGSKSLQVMDIRVLSGCDTVSCPLSKAKIGALNSLQAGDFPDLFQMLGDNERKREREKERKREREKERKREREKERKRE